MSGYATIAAGVLVGCSGLAYGMWLLARETGWAVVLEAAAVVLCMLAVVGTSMGLIVYGSTLL